MRFVLYTGGWTVFFGFTLWSLRDNWFWPVALGVWGFIWLVGIPLALLLASQRMVESLPEEDDAQQS